MAPATRGTRGATPVTPPAKRARTGKTAQNPVKTEDAWVDVKPEPGVKKQTDTPAKRSRASSKMWRFPAVQVTVSWQRRMRQPSGVRTSVFV